MVAAKVERPAEDGIPIGDFPALIQGTVKVFDVDGDGTVSPNELVRAAELYLKSLTETKKLKKLVAIGSFIILFVLFAMMGLTYSVVEMSKETSTGTDGAMKVKGSTEAVKTAPVKFAQEGLLALLQVPPADLDGLKSVNLNVGAAYYRLPVIGYASYDVPKVDAAGQKTVKRSLILWTDLLQYRAIELSDTLDPLTLKPLQAGTGVMKLKNEAEAAVAEDAILKQQRRRRLQEVDEQLLAAGSGVKLDTGPSMPKDATTAEVAAAQTRATKRAEAEERVDAKGEETYTTAIGEGHTHETAIKKAVTAAAEQRKTEVLNNGGTADQSDAAKTEYAVRKAYEATKEAAAGTADAHTKAVVAAVDACLDAGGKKDECQDEIEHKVQEDGGTKKDVAKAAATCAERGHRHENPNADEKEVKKARDKAFDKAAVDQKLTGDEVADLKKERLADDKQEIETYAKEAETKAYQKAKAQGKTEVQAKKKAKDAKKEAKYTATIIKGGTAAQAKAVKNAETAKDEFKEAFDMLLPAFTGGRRLDPDAATKAKKKAVNTAARTATKECMKNGGKTANSTVCLQAVEDALLESDDAGLDLNPQEKAFAMLDAAETAIRLEKPDASDIEIFDTMKEKVHDVADELGFDPEWADEMIHEHEEEYHEDYDYWVEEAGSEAYDTAIADGWTTEEALYEQVDAEAHTAANYIYDYGGSEEQAEEVYYETMTHHLYDEEKKLGHTEDESRQHTIDHCIDDGGSEEECTHGVLDALRDYGVDPLDVTTAAGDLAEYAYRHTHAHDEHIDPNELKRKKDAAVATTAVKEGKDPATVEKLVKTAEAKTKARDREAQTTRGEEAAATATRQGKPPADVRKAKVDAEAKAAATAVRAKGGNFKQAKKAQVETKAKRRYEEETNAGRPVKEAVRNAVADCLDAGGLPVACKAAIVNEVKRNSTYTAAATAEIAGLAAQFATEKYNPAATKKEIYEAATEAAEEAAFDAGLDYDEVAYLGTKANTTAAYWTETEDVGKDP